MKTFGELDEMQTWVPNTSQKLYRLSCPVWWMPIDFSDLTVAPTSRLYFTCNPPSWHSMRAVLSPNQCGCHRRKGVTWEFLVTYGVLMNTVATSVSMYVLLTNIISKNVFLILKEVSVFWIFLSRSKGQLWFWRAYPSHRTLQFNYSIYCNLLQ